MKITPEKVIRDGQVAVLYSPEYGAGWSTWSQEHKEFMVFDKWLIEARERCATSDEVQEHLESLGMSVYTGGWFNTKIHWVPQGCRFEINEYDGYESVTVITPDYGFIA